MTYTVTTVAFYTKSTDVLHNTYANDVRLHSQVLVSYISRAMNDRNIKNCPFSSIRGLQNERK